MYEYIHSEAALWTAGFRKPDGEWEPDSDHSSPEEAAARVNWLNGSSGIWVYIRSEPRLWTVGRYDDAGDWHSESDHGTAEEAAKRVEALNSVSQDAVLAALRSAEVGRDARETLRTSLREIVRESGLKQSFIADRMGTTEKHLSALLLGKNLLTVEWAQRIVDVCRQPLRLDITPAEWVEDVITWRERAEAAEAKLAAYEIVRADNEGTTR